MKKRFFIFTMLIIFAGLLGFLAVSVLITSRNNLSIAKSTVMETARISAGLFNDATDLQEFVTVGGDTRITVISAEGAVLADSRPAEIAPIESYLYRPEVVAAEIGFPEVQVRHSATHNADFIYYALRVPTPDSHVFVRAAIPVAQIDAYLWQSLPLMILLFTALAAICFFAVRGISNKILQPFSQVEQNLRNLSRGEKTEPVRAGYVEIEKITREIDEIALLLKQNYNALRDEKNKLSHILNSIGVGLFVADGDENLTLVNNAASEIFGASPDVAGKKVNYLVPDKALAAVIGDCAKSAKSALFEFVHEGKIYLVTVKRLPDTGLTMSALADITESRENAKRREEFFANASHELKTPLTAIRGFNELTALNNRDENLSKYIDGISRETARLMSLINDMLRLSELENKDEVNPEDVSLYEVVHEVREAVSAAIEEKAIVFEASGNATVSAEPHHVFETVKNLVENAVRYNTTGGRVFVLIKSSEKSAKLTVSDNGIGISPAEQTKIFERFYRVEKSRSAQGGGTGLGLSIVKHVCALYGWRLSLKSKLGVGTDVTVEFPVP